MKLKTVGTLCAIVGVVIASFTGSAIARHAGFDSESWLIAAFALGIFLASQGPVLRLQQEVRDLQARLPGGIDTQQRSARFSHSRAGTLGEPCDI